jgi:hypothetical protein
MGLLVENLILRQQLGALRRKSPARVKLRNIDHTRTKVKSPQTNDIVERFPHGAQ